MKTIVVPVDFSPVSTDAARYALCLAPQMQASVVLFHAYQASTYIGANEPGLAELQENVRSEQLMRLQEFTERLKQSRNPQTILQIACEDGIPSEAILKFASDQNCDLIVMGARSDGNIIDKIFDNTTISLLHKNTRFPVMIVPAQAHYQPIRNIVLACDHADSVSEVTACSLNELATAFNATIDVLKVVTPTEFLIYGAYIPHQDQLKHKLEGSSNIMNFEIDESKVKGIVHKAAQLKADLIALVYHKHSTLHRIFEGDTTKELLSKTKKVLLVYPEPTDQ